jgi:hypothetical protein
MLKLGAVAFLTPLALVDAIPLDRAAANLSDPVVDYLSALAVVNPLDREEAGRSHRGAEWHSTVIGDMALTRTHFGQRRMAKIHIDRLASCGGTSHATHYVPESGSALPMTASHAL